MTTCDIPAMLSEIKEKPSLSEARIGDLIGVSQPTVSRILNGQADCKVKTWKAIVELHSQHNPGADLLFQIFGPRYAWRAGLRWHALDSDRLLKFYKIDFQK